MKNLSNTAEIQDFSPGQMNTEFGHQIQRNQLKRQETTSQDIAQYFETPNKLVRVTSLEISAPNANFAPDQTFQETKEEDSNDQREREEIIEMRRKFLEQKKKERQNKFQEDTLYKYNRDEMIEKVSRIIYEHILHSEENMPISSAGAELFNERIYKRQRWMINTTHGFCSTLPNFIYSLEKIEYYSKM